METGNLKPSYHFYSDAFTVHTVTHYKFQAMVLSIGKISVRL